MSLSLLQGYSSEEEDDKQAQFQNSSDEDDDYSDEVVEEEALNNNNSYTNSVFDLSQQQQKKSVDSGLPSAFDAFSEITGPPRFLNNSIVEEEHPLPEHVDHRRHRRHRKDNKNKNLPAGVVVEAKSQLVGMHERVRSDVEGNVNAFPKSSSSSSSMVQSQKDLLNKEAEKKKGSTVKDKEKNKRMKGQSSHATWKSETEMHLRQQFD